MSAVDFDNISGATISLPADFKIVAVDDKLEPPSKFLKQQQQQPLQPTAAEDPAPALGVLKSFNENDDPVRVFIGTGFNTIFRPENKKTPTKFDKPVPPGDNVLELNLTAETIAFSKSLGSVPNRGLIDQGDIFLNGVPYTQSISDVTNRLTGKPDGKPNNIHFEPGLFMVIPSSDTNPVLGPTINRMASIPHGTTINAQGVAPKPAAKGGPKIPSVKITPFDIRTKQEIPFPSQDVTKPETPRLPQDLKDFAKAGTITQKILDDPNEVLRKANIGKNFTETIEFTVSTKPTKPADLDLSGGTANIAFLDGKPKALGAAANAPPNPNANAAQMTSTFWVSKVKHEITIPVFKPAPNQKPLEIKPKPQNPDTVVPTFLVLPPKEVTTPKKLAVEYTQIQYSQTVLLNFATLSWPHISVSTLVPQEIKPDIPSSFWQ